MLRGRVRFCSPFPSPPLLLPSFHENRSAEFIWMSFLTFRNAQGKGWGWGGDDGVEEGLPCCEALFHSFSVASGAVYFGS